MSGQFQARADENEDPTDRSVNPGGGIIIPRYSRDVKQLEDENLSSQYDSRHLEYPSQLWFQHCQVSEKHASTIIRDFNKFWEPHSRLRGNWLNENAKQLRMQYKVPEKYTIHLAVQFGMVQFIPAILELDPSSLDDSDENIGTALHRAAATGQVEIVKSLIELDTQVNAQGGIYGTALQAAAVKGHRGVVQTLLESGADVDFQGGLYGTALIAASENGHESIVRVLLERGADVDFQGGLYGTALIAASENGHESIVQILLERGADVNAQGGELYGTALMIASKYGHEDIVQILLEWGADVNAQGDGLYGPALICASESEHKRLVQLLLGRDANMNAQGGRHSSALLAASAGRHENIVRMLLDAGAKFTSSIESATSASEDEDSDNWTGTDESIYCPSATFPQEGSFLFSAFGPSPTHNHSQQ